MFICNGMPVAEHFGLVISVNIIYEMDMRRIFARINTISREIEKLNFTRGWVGVGKLVHG